MKMMERLKTDKGETLIETVCALLIAALSMVMLAGAVVSAAKVNKQTKEMDTGLKMENAQIGPSIKVTICGGDICLLEDNSTPSGIKVNSYITNDDNKYIWFTTTTE